MITLEQLLESRDRRVAHQQELLAGSPACTLICLTVQLPGPVKRNNLSLAIARAGVAAIRSAFTPVFEELRDLETGFEGYFLVPLPALEAKRETCQIEDTHPLGRLMDLDVLYHVMPDPDRASAHCAEGNYFLQGFAKNQFPSATHEDAIHSERHSCHSERHSCHSERHSCHSERSEESVDGVHSVSREDIGLQPRRCLLCGNEVRYCMRARTHTKEELLARIEQMVREYGA